MISDVFHKRYPHAFHFREDAPVEVYVFLRQCAQIIFNDLGHHLDNMSDLCDGAYTKLVRELGHGLCRGKNVIDSCFKAMHQSYSLMDDSHLMVEDFVAYRFSLVELLFATIEKEIRTPKKTRSGIFRKQSWTTNETTIAALRNAIHELNHRAREAEIPYNYHNGLFQFTSDDVTQNHVHTPFWSLVADAKWNNVDIDMKEAIDRHDQNGRDVALYAMKALESTIKIISDEKNFTLGSENGASNYIDNLVSSKNGRFISVWESDNLKSLFKNLRNPHGHGPGSSPPPQLSKEQEQWVIETAMIWIKSLIRRM
jgi:hypothetical protein